MARRMPRITLLLLILLCFAGCAGQQELLPETVPVTEAFVPTAAPAEETEATEITQPPTEPPITLHSGMREDGSFSQGTLFLGDSLTFQMLYGYMGPKGHLGDARHIAVCGSRTTAYFDGTQIRCSAETTLASPEFDNLTYPEAIASLGEEAEAIYLMWGTNFTPDGTAQDYIDILDHMLQSCPNATVFLQTVPFGWAAPYEIVNQRIQEAWDHYRQIGEERVRLLDTFAGIGMNVSSDGVHLNDDGKAAWYETLTENANAFEYSE